MGAFGLAADRSMCPCCQNFGELPSAHGVAAMVPGDVVKTMCDACIGAAFLGTGTHPHPFIHAAPIPEGDNR